MSWAFWTGPSLRAGERCPDRGEPQVCWARRAASGKESAVLWLCPVGPDAAAVWWSSPSPSGGCWLSPKSAPAGTESGPSLPPRTEPSALWSRAAARRRREKSKKCNVLVRTPPSKVWFNRFQRLLWFVFVERSGVREHRRYVLCGDEKRHRLIYREIFIISGLQNMGAAIPPLLLLAFLMQNNCGWRGLLSLYFIYLRSSLHTTFECVVHIWIPGIHAFINLKVA